MKCCTHPEHLARIEAQRLRIEAELPHAMANERRNAIRRAQRREARQPKRVTNKIDQLNALARNPGCWE